jgi:heat-inducible transcriptional repressor
VAVLSNGVVERRAVEFAEAVGDERVAAASARLAAHLVGASLAGLPPIPASGDAVTDEIVNRACQALAEDAVHELEQVYVGGTARIAAAFEAIETVRKVLQTLEQQYLIVSLLRDLLDRGLSVSIGHEHGFTPLAECSIVMAPYEVDGEPAGTIAVLGPTRMNYPQAMAAVAAVGSRLGRALSEG